MLGFVRVARQRYMGKQPIIFIGSNNKCSLGNNQHVLNIKCCILTCVSVYTILLYRMSRISISGWCPCAWVDTSPKQLLLPMNSLQ